MGVTKTGDWNGVTRTLERDGERLRSEVEKATNRNGRLLESTMKGHLEAQDLPWPPLSPDYLKRKIAEGFSEQTLIRTGSLMANIRYHAKDWKSGFVGILRNVMNSDGESLVNIAAVHEFGTRDGRVPARPYVAPTLEERRDEIVRAYEEAIERVFR
jgi:phage gpG-like protein